MKITIVSYFCPPEVAAPASRVHENAVRFAQMGHDVTILTGLPNHPRGKVFDGYRWRFRQEEYVGQVRVIRMGSWIAPNTTGGKRMRAYLSLMLAQIVGAFTSGPADIVIGTSPPLFTAFAGYIVSCIKRCPFVFEVRDLWPENMIAIGALRNRPAIWALSVLESLLYRRAKRIVPVTQGFASYIRDKGIPPQRISVIPNGVSLDDYRPVDYPNDLAEELGVKNRFVVAYIGTVGINHGIQTVLDTGALLQNHPEVVLLVVGDGAERAELEVQAKKQGLMNVRFLGEKPRDEMPMYHALADATMVLLKKSSYFGKVIPSKIFVAMGFACPLILGVPGESRGIVEDAGAGIAVEPESPHAVVSAIEQLMRMKQDGRLSEMGRMGRDYVGKHFNRDTLAGLYMQALDQTAHHHTKQDHHDTTS